MEENRARIGPEFDVNGSIDDEFSVMRIRDLFMVEFSSINFSLFINEISTSFRRRFGTSRNIRLKFDENPKSISSRELVDS